MRATQSAHNILNCWVTLAIEGFVLERPNHRDYATYGVQISGVCWKGYLVGQ